MAAIEFWLLVEWDNGTYDVVNILALQEDMKIAKGKLRAVLMKNGVRESATVIMSAADKNSLFQEKCYMTNLKLENQVAGPSNVREPSINTRNGLSDDSCWTGYSPEETSTSESSTSPEEVMAQTKCVDMGTSTDVITTYDEKTQTDCSKALRTAQRAYLMSLVDIYGPSITSDMDINNDTELGIIFNIVNRRVKRITQIYSLPTLHINDDPKNVLNEESYSQQADKSNDCKRKLSSDQHSDSDSKKNTNAASEACRSNQAKSTHRNILNCEASTSRGRRSITKKIPVKYKIATCSNSASLDTSNSMVPLGSGDTMISRTQFNEIKWSSYSIATRQLLTAVFPRSVLATHSLSGRGSHAFKHLPPKTCLDKRKVADIVTTVTKVCDVKENLVRMAITLKCADEAKKKRQDEAKQSSISLNLSTDNLNQSCNSDQENQPMN